MRQDKRHRRTEFVLWSLQILLAALFLFAGAMKLSAPSDALAAQSSLPVAFLRFIGTCETLGALGLILPGVFRIRRELTSLAAAGLTIIMLGATAVSIKLGVVAAGIPFCVGVACAFIAYRRNPTRVERAALAR
jgi:uncharacterized membrane protein YphA (DoxX/SURF4 family)